jgi:anti-sigma regulatory factor (Ser/Thr protein kinase)
VEIVVAIHKSIPISASDLSQIGNARRQAIAMAASLGFDEVRQGEIGIVVTEAARNIAAHGESGELLLCPWSFGGALGIDVLALDRGKGISNLEQALTDGYSTAGTPGEGLGAILRLSGDLQIYSSPTHGTALLARVFQTPPPHSALATGALGAITVPITGESVCGDAWSLSHTPERSIYIVADGLGHGPFASEAAQEAIRVFHQRSDWPPEQILKEIHGALAKTRGAAVSIAEILRRQQVVNYAGAGNIAGVIWSQGKGKSMVSMNGTVGHTVAKFQSFSYSFDPNSLLIMHSDGIGTRWGLDQYAGILQRHPALMAGVIYRDFSRKRDDATVLVCRMQSA